MKKNYLLFFIFSFIFSPSLLSAANRYVSVNGAGDGLSWASPKGSIQAAVWDCAAGDTVFVSSGTYNEMFAITDGVSVMGGYHPTTGERDIDAYVTTLDGQGLGKYLIVKYDAACVHPTLIEGFTIRNAEHSNEGGGAYIRGNVTLSRCYIVNCKGSNGGGVFNNGGIVRDCIIELCSSTSSGGAIRNNGGLVENTIMRGNQGKYGTIRNENGGIVRNCILHNNTASVTGWPNSGGIYNPTGIVANCILACNTGEGYAAIHSDGKTFNTIMWNNKGPEGFSDPIAYINGAGSSNNAAVSGFEMAKDAYTLNSNNAATDGPNFKAPTLFAGVPTTPADIAAMRASDWSFSAESPLIDLGTSANTETPVSDIVGTSRPKGAAIDLGAYEFDPNAVTVAVEAVSMTIDTLRLEEKTSQWLSAIVTPTNATNKKILWESSNTAVATVESGLITAVSVGTAIIRVTTIDGRKKDSCVVEVTEEIIPYIHPDALAADLLSENDYTVPTYTKMLIAKYAVVKDSSETNLLALQQAIAALINKNMPYTVVATINGDPKTRMGFAWFTNQDITNGKIQLVAKANAVEADFASPAFEINSTQRSVNNINYAVYDNNVLSAANLPTNYKRSYRSHKALATGLTPNTTYSYRVGFDNAWSEIRTFTTAVDSKDEFKFLYMTDSHIMNQEYINNTRWVATAAANKAPDARFLLFTGDFVETGTVTNAEWEWEQFFETSMKPAIQKFPMVPTDGNHDDSPNLNYTHHFNTDSIFNQSAATKPQFHGINYSFVYGDALFIVYSQQDYWRTGYMNSLKPWFRAQVEANPNTKWRIAAVHKCLFTGSGHQEDADAKIFRQEMLPLFDELNIDFVIQGHDHVYEVIGPVDNQTKTVIPGSVSGVKDVAVNTNTNMTGKEGGIYNVEGGTLYFNNSTAGRKRYYPYTKEQMEADYAKHEVANYWDLFTGKFGQPGAPVFSEISVNTNEITVSTYTTSEAAAPILFDSFKIVKGNESGLENNNEPINSLFPVPATDKVNTTVNNINNVTAFDISGRSINLTFKNQTIDVSDLSNGIYIVKINADNKTFTSRLLKK